MTWQRGVCLVQFNKQPFLNTTTVFFVFMHGLPVLSQKVGVKTVPDNAFHIQNMGFLCILRVEGTEVLFCWIGWFCLWTDRRRHSVLHVFCQIDGTLEKRLKYIQTTTIVHHFKLNNGPRCSIPTWSTTCVNRKKRHLYWQKFDLPASVFTPWIIGFSVSIFVWVSYTPRERQTSVKRQMLQPIQHRHI